MDANLLFFARRLVLSRDVDNSVGVDVESDLDLREAARRRGEADEIELAEQLVVGCHFALALEDTDRDRSLVVLGGGEDLAFLSRNGGVAFDETREHTPQCFDAKRQRGHVEKQHILDIALQHAGLNGGADRHHLVGIHALVRLLAEDIGHCLLDLRHAGHTAHEHDLIDFLGLNFRILHCVPTWLFGALNQLIDQLFQLGPPELDLKMLWAVLISRDERQANGGFQGR